MLNLLIIRIFLQTIRSVCAYIIRVYSKYQLYTYYCGFKYFIFFIDIGDLCSHTRLINVFLNIDSLTMTRFCFGKLFPLCTKPTQFRII